MKYFHGLVLFVVFWISGCAWLVAPPEDDQQARAVLQQLMSRNAQMDRFKGILQARVQARGEVISGRVAWAAAVPNRMRLEWLNPVGQPLTSLAGNGRTLVIVSHTDQKRYILRQTPTVLADVIHAPIGLEDLLNLLSGRPLVPDFEVVQRLDGATLQGIRLLNRWRRILTEIHLDADGRPVDQRIYDAEGQLRYAIHWHAWRTAQDFTVPQQFNIVTVSGESLDIQIVRLMPDPDQAPTIFELPPPDTF